jgi:hypothetical protein
MRIAEREIMNAYRKHPDVKVVLLLGPDVT